MPKFNVKVYLTPYEYNGIEANSAEEAEDKVMKAEFMGTTYDEIAKVEVKELKDEAEARDEYHQLRNDDPAFEEMWDDTEEDFQEWYEDNYLNT